MGPDSVRAVTRSHPLRVGVLASGGGTLLQAILAEQDESYRVVAVVSDRIGIEALARARRAGVPDVVVDFASFEGRDAFSEAVASELSGRDVELACSAGFMRLLSPSYFKRLGVPTLNSHPALLPAFPGAHGVRDALAYGVKVTGTTIHFLDEETDHGPIVVQEVVEVLPDDTEESLHERVKTVERRLYPYVIRRFAAGTIKVEGRRVLLIG
ncbi:MAG: phosphoribosylglycinamide formyltransferase [Actinomycetota bacterium]